MAQKKTTRKKGAGRKRARAQREQQAAKLPCLRAIEEAFGATPLIYATGERQPRKLLGAQIGADVLPVFREHLEAIGDVEALALVLHTSGGALDVPWPLVNMLRHHASASKKLHVVVPEHALSAGTLVALGADTVHMLPHAFLSPVDPRGTWRQGQEAARSYSVEDVMGYVDFVTDRVGVRDQEALVQALAPLTKEVDATILGSIHRTRSLIDRLSRSLLQLHMRQISQRNRIDQVVDFLTHELFTHQHLIPYWEAKEVIGFGDMVKLAAGPQADAAKEARCYINERLSLDTPLDVETEAPEAGGEPKKLGPVERAIVVSPVANHAYTSQFRVARGEGGEICVRPFGFPRWQLVQSK